MKKNQRRLSTITLLLIFCSCGFYSFSGSTLPSHLKTVGIPVFDDRTSEFGVREALTEALINGITRDNSLKISDPRTADCILEGTILRIRDEAGTVNISEQVKDIKIYLTVNVRFNDLKKGKTMWEEQITQWGTYEPDSPNGRSDGIEEVVKKLTEDILNKIVAGW